ncbi:hypothetical protein Ahy_B10g102389 [Arachis hypogaea]|uniref:Uncharacterized protein n=1 Tax=Arachis hypogaea TaxID=3818 RepID=A0A444X1T4_ARAHY|nr:hypothetical protein Ahy_B10g102389 [Arachis hypogaea]
MILLIYMVLEAHEWLGNNPMPTEIWLLLYLLPFHPGNHGNKLDLRLKQFRQHPDGERLTSLQHITSVFAQCLDREYVSIRSISDHAMPVEHPHDFNARYGVL